MTSTLSQAVPLQKTIKSTHLSSSLFQYKSCSNAHQRSRRSVTSSVKKKNVSVKTHGSSHRSTKRNSCCNNNRHSFRSSYQRDNMSTKESSSLDIIETFQKCHKKNVTFARPFINVIKIKSYKECNQLQTFKQIILETDAVNNKKDKVGCSCVIY